MKLFIAVAVLIGVAYADWKFAPSQGCMILKEHQHSHSAGAIKNKDGSEKFSDFQCRDTCRDDPACKAVDYRGYDGRCFMHKSEQPLIPATASSTGSPSGWQSVSQYRKEGTCHQPNPNPQGCMVEHLGKHSMGAYPIKGANGREQGWTPDDCRDHCARTAECKAVDYRGSDKTCHLHKSYQPLRDVTEGSTGVSEFWTVTQFRKKEGVSVCPGY